MTNYSHFQCMDQVETAALTIEASESDYSCAKYAFDVIRRFLYFVWQLKK